jgi:CheY-like chemotaxis protein
MQWNPGDLIRITGSTTYYYLVEQKTSDQWVVRDLLTQKTTQASSELFEFAGYRPSSLKVNRTSPRNAQSHRQLGNPRPTTTPLPQGKGGDNRSKHVLLVDDDEMLLESCQEMLQAHHLQVSTAASGAAALKLIKSQDVDAIVCDWFMPTMAGDIFYQEVQKIKPFLCQRFIFMTGYEGHPQIKEFLLKKKPVVLYKPVTLGKLLGTLNLAFSRDTAKQNV